MQVFLNCVLSESFFSELPSDNFIGVLVDYVHFECLKFGIVCLVLCTAEYLNVKFLFLLDVCLNLPV